MQHTQQLFLQALRAALKNEQVDWNDKIDAQEWMELFQSKRQIFLRIS